MGVEVVDSKLAHVSVETGSEENSSLIENAKINQVMGLDEPIKFGSHGADEPVKGEVNKVSEVNFPKDAVDEWPAPKQIHSFFFVKYRSFEDQKLKGKLEVADRELHRKNQMRSQLIEKLRAKKSERAQVISHLKAHGEENKQYRMKMDEKRKEMEPLQHALGQLRGSNFGGRDRRSGLCSSEEELNDVELLIKSLQYRIQHESIPLNEEKQILREIKQLEGTREKVIANAAMRAKIQESMGEKEVLQDQVKLIGVDLDGVRKEQQVVRAKVKNLEEEKEVIEKEIKSLEEELTALTQKRDQTFENIQQLRKLREEGNSSFYENRSMLIKAKELAAKKDVEALRDLSDTEVSKFISVWSSNKAFREDYERRILPSLDMRQLSRDGRMRNPDEKPLLVVESTPIEAEVVPRANAKQQEKNVKLAKEDSHPVASSIQKSQKENVKQQKDATDKKKETAVKPTDDINEEEYFVTEKLQKDPPKLSEVDEVKLKEMKREEEMAKAKLAQERKKKLAEKAAAKAAVKKQKEAEKKEKEREKRLKKKASSAGVSDPAESEEQTEAATEVAAEPEKVEEAVETQAPPKIKDRKENVMRFKKRSKGGDSLPKVILKRKKATNYWYWAAPAAALAVVLLIIVGYKYLL